MSQETPKLTATMRTEDVEIEVSTLNSDQQNVYKFINSLRASRGVKPCAPDRISSFDKLLVDSAIRSAKDLSIPMESPEGLAIAGALFIAFGEAVHKLSESCHCDEELGASVDIGGAAQEFWIRISCPSCKASSGLVHAEIAQVLAQAAGFRKLLQSIGVDIDGEAPPTKNCEECDEDCEYKCPPPTGSVH